MQNFLTQSSLKYIPLSTKKIRFVLNEIQKKTYKETLMILELLPYKACEYIWQILNMAIANANFLYKNKKEHIYIEKTCLGAGPTQKRIKFKSQGRISIIKKKTCHITLFLKIF
uniref:50S ribosomal protein L22, chloroplastic n=1 Tax=Pteridomonas danica TaxID=38822 RepID=A0A7T1FUF6_9STRA|nr:ribosomal protein L22 [Pteridomonas danica]QPM99301.1 ribosomal protein L22 [Pteridomonas danica]